MAVFYVWGIVAMLQEARKDMVAREAVFESVDIPLYIKSMCLMLLPSGGFLIPRLKNYQTCCLDKYATFRLNCRKWFFLRIESMSKRKIFKFVPEEQVSLTMHKGLPEIEKNGQSLTEFKYA